MKAKTTSPLSPASAAVLFIVASFSLLLPLFTLIQSIQRDELLQANGREVLLEITNCRMVEPSPGSKIDVPEVSFVYFVDERPYTFSQTLTGRCNNYRQATTVKGMVWLDDPRKVFLTTPDQIHQPFFLRYTGEIMALAIGGFIAVVLYRQTYKFLMSIKN